MKSIQGWARFFIGVTVMFVGTLAVVARPDPTRWTGRDSSAVLPRLAATAAPTVVPLVQTQPGPTYVLRFIRQYTLCGHTRSEILIIHSLPSAEQLALQYPGWEILPTSQGYTLTRRIHQLCANHIRVVLRSNKLAIYRNTGEGGTLEHLQDLTLVLEDLPSSARDSLSAGKTFDSLADLENYLESIGS
jgi:hypothetical protein